MLSYRPETEKPFAGHLFDVIAQFTTSATADAASAGDGSGRPIRVFLDQERLQGGQKWEDCVVQGLCYSFVFVPIVSEGSVSGMAKRFEQAPDRVDYVLLEWMLALELHERGRMLRIYPLFMGEWKQPSASTSSRREPRMLSFDRDTQLARVPNVVSEPTWRRLCELASRFPLIPGDPGAALREQWRARSQRFGASIYGTCVLRTVTPMSPCWRGACTRIALVASRRCWILSPTKWHMSRTRAIVSNSSNGRSVKA